MVVVNDWYPRIGHLRRMLCAVARRPDHARMPQPWATGSGPLRTPVLARHLRSAHDLRWRPWSMLVDAARNRPEMVARLRTRVGCNAVHSRISARGKRAASPPKRPNPPFDPWRGSAQDWSAIAPLSGSTPSPPGALHAGFHTRFAEVLPRVALIVSAAAQAKILNRALATLRPRIHVVELEAATRATAPPIRRDIATLLTISQEHRARNRCRDVALGVGLAVGSGRQHSKGGRVGGVRCASLCPSTTRARERGVQELVRTRSRLTAHRSPKHSLGCGSRTTHRHA